MRDYGDGAPLAVAHRGGAGLAPENTMSAFERSVALGVRYLETDVRVTGDGVAVVFHDANLRRVTGVRCRVDQISWRDLRAIRVAGEPIPRLAEVLDAFPHTRFTVDVKDPRALDPLVADLRAARATGRVCLAGAPDRVLADARDRLGPALSTALGVESLTRLALVPRAGARPWRMPGAQFAHVPLRLGRLPVFAERVLAAAHDLGLRVLVWTVDDPALMHRLLDQGCDGVITDRPDLLREVLVARGQWTPTGAGSGGSRPGPAPAPPVRATGP